MESLLPSKLTINSSSEKVFDEAASMIDYKKESHSNKHRTQNNLSDSNEENDDDDDDQYIDDDDEDGHPQVHSCQTH